MESKLSVDMTRTGRLLVATTLYSCDILEQQVFGAIVGDLMPFNIKNLLEYSRVGFYYFFLVVLVLLYSSMTLLMLGIVFALYAQEKPRK